MNASSGSGEWPRRKSFGAVVVVIALDYRSGPRRAKPCPQVLKAANVSGISTLSQPPPLCLYFPPRPSDGENSMNVLVAGGAGYIGSHTVKRLKESGHTPVIYDNASRGHRIVAKILAVPAIFADLNDRETLTRTLRENKIETVMH